MMRAPHWNPKSTCLGRRRKRRYLRPEEPPRQKEAKEGDHLLRIQGMRGSTRAQRKTNLSFMKVHGAGMLRAGGSRTTR